MDSHREKIKQSIRNCIEKFRNKEIDYNVLINNISGNLGALDTVSQELERAKYRVCGKLDIIHYTVDSDKEFIAMLEEVDRFEKCINNIL